MLLRGYQKELIYKIRQELKRGKTAVCAVLGCGGGKSVIEAMIAKSATSKGSFVLFLVHRQELCQQIKETFERCNVNMDLCEIIMVQTASRRLKTLRKPDLIITDECHHANANSYIRIYNHFKDVLKVGFTATPVRLSDGGLGKVFDSLIASVSTRWLIENQFLAPYKYFSVKLADVSGLKTKMGDYDLKQVAALMDSNYIYGETTKTWFKLAKNKQTIVYCSSIKSSQQTAKEFVRQGVNAAHIDGTTPTAERQKLVQQFRQKKIQVLCNVDLFGEGFDVPDCECVVLLRPTQSLTVFIQQSMRSMRYLPNKTALIIDHVGNVYRHEFPDTAREWSLDSKKRKKEANKVKIKECPTCFACMRTNIMQCENCGQIFESTKRADKEVVETDLVEINDYKKATSFEQLVLIQKSRKYKFMWVIHQARKQGIPIPKKYHYMARFAR